MTLLCTSMRIAVFASAVILLLMGSIHAQPVLSVQQNQDRKLQLRWSDATGAYRLEEATALGGAASWQNAAVALIREGGNVSVTLAATEQARYFRLARDRFTTVSATSPVNAETAVSVNRET